VFKEAINKGYSYENKEDFYKKTASSKNVRKLKVKQGSLLLTRSKTNSQQSSESISLS